MTGNLEKEIIEELGRYKLVARYQNGIHRGVLWRDGMKILDTEGESNAQVAQKLRADLCALLISEKVPTEVAKVVDAMLHIWPNLEENQKQMLQAHFHAPERKMTARQLASAVGYKDFSATNLKYGNVGKQLLQEIPRDIPKYPNTDEPIYTFAIADGARESGAPTEEWVWVMRPEIAQALLISGLVKA